MYLPKVRRQVSTVPIIFSAGPVSSWFFLWQAPLTPMSAHVNKASSWMSVNPIKTGCCHLIYVLSEDEKYHRPDLIRLKWQIKKVWLKLFCSSCLNQRFWTWRRLHKSIIKWSQYLGHFLNPGCLLYAYSVLTKQSSHFNRKQKLVIFDTNGLFLHFWNSRSVANSYKRAAARALKSTNTYIVLSRYFIVPLFSRLFADDNFGVRKTSSSSYSSSTLCYSSKQSFSPSLWKKNWLRACYCYRYRAKQGRRKVWKSKGGGKVAFQGLLN